MESDSLHVSFIVLKNLQFYDARDRIEFCWTSAMAPHENNSFDFFFCFKNNFSKKFQLYGKQIQWNINIVRLNVDRIEPSVKIVSYFNCRIIETNKLFSMSTHVAVPFIFRSSYSTEIKSSEIRSVSLVIGEHGVVIHKIGSDKPQFAFFLSFSAEMERNETKWKTHSEERIDSSNAEQIEKQTTQCRSYHQS